MHIEPDDILCSPTFTSPGIGILSPVSNALSQPDISIARLECEVNLLVSKGQTCQHVVVTTDDNTNGTVRTIVRNGRRIVLVLVWFETKLVESAVQPLMKRYGIGTKGNYLTLAIDLEVEMLAGDVIVVVHILILQAVCILIPSTSLGFITFGRRKGFGRIADMDGSIMLIYILHINTY